LTLVLPKNEIIPAIVTAGRQTVGLRMPSQPIAQQLLEKLDFPLAAPSANPFGYISPTTAQHVFDQLNGKIPYILDGGPCTVGVESTIIGFERDAPVVYRLGGTPIEEIEAITGKIRFQINQSSNPSAPGQLKSHYAPVKPVLTGNMTELIGQHPENKIAVISFQKAWDGPNLQHNWVLSKSGDLEEAAINLFKALREADQSDADIIFAEIFPEKGLGRAINDRLKRAAG
jgi:L-threonylcarbamoyladenylate synthase